MFVDEVLYHNTDNTENAVPSSILRDGAAADILQSQLAVLDTPADADDYTVEIKIDLDSYVEDSSTIRGCHKICRLCAHLVYEYKLISIFPPDKTKCLASKINRLLPEKVCNIGSCDGSIPYDPKCYFVVLIVVIVSVVVVVVVAATCLVHDNLPQYPHTTLRPLSSHPSVFFQKPAH